MARHDSDAVDALFVEALEHPPDERAAFLRTECQDPDLRAAVEAMLADYDEAAGLFGAPANAVLRPALTDGPPDDPLDLEGTQVGRYRLEDEIGVGGMGVVYRAERTDGDVEQTVAVKLLRPRLHSSDAEARFRAEQQVLAGLDHPNVAQFLDGGVTAPGSEPGQGGRPYLVMEHVDGVPITEYADANDLDLEARLDLLSQVLEAVEAAHRQLVVHRDLKPSNVLVTETEAGRPHVTLLDFGIAKLLDDALSVTRPETRTGQPLMTPAYAAPEQVSGGEITTATDVYQLGVLAYELLAGTRPFDLSDASLTEIERIVLEESPDAPSESARRSGRETASALHGDLDTILLKALRKEPERRYASAEALSADLQRYRRGEPVEARSATLGYRAKKFVSRNRTAVGAGVLVTLLVVAYAVTVTVQADRLAEERNRARTEAETARQVTSFLTNLFEASQPSEAQGDTVTARDVLAQGLARVEALDQQPDVQVEVLGTISATYGALGEYDRGEQIARRAVALSRNVHGPQSPEVAKSLDNLGVILREKGQYAAADSIHRAALAIKKTHFGLNHPRVAQTMNDLGFVLAENGEYAAADSLYRKALTIQRQQLGSDHLRTAQTLNNLGILRRKQSEYAAADSVYRKALAIRRKQLGAEHRETLETMHNLGVTLSYRGDLARADSILRDVVALRRGQLGANHASVATTLSTLGIVLIRKGEYAAADSVYREALRIQRTQLGPQHPDVATSLNNLAVVLWRRGQYAAVDSVYRKVLAIRRSQLSPNHPEVATTLNNLGAVLRERGEYATADSMLQEALAIRREKLGTDHPRTATTLYNRAKTHAEMDAYSTAERFFQEVLSLRRTHLEDDHGDVQEVAQDLVELYEEWGKPEEGRKYRSLAGTEE